MKVRTYLNYGGNCAEAFRFYEQNLGAKISFLMTFAQAPDQSQAQGMDKNAVLHAQLEIGDTQVMASDVPQDRFQPMRSVYLCYSVETDAEAEPGWSLLLPMLTPRILLAGFTRARAEKRACWPC